MRSDFYSMTYNINGWKIQPFNYTCVLKENLQIGS